MDLLDPSTTGACRTTAFGWTVAEREKPGHDKITVMFASALPAQALMALSPPISSPVAPEVPQPQAPPLARRPIVSHLDWLSLVRAGGSTALMSLGLLFGRILP
jgi:hypothetical protein